MHGKYNWIPTEALQVASELNRWLRNRATFTYMSAWALCSFAYNINLATIQECDDSQNVCQNRLRQIWQCMQTPVTFVFDRICRPTIVQNSEVQNSEDWRSVSLFGHTKSAHAERILYRQHPHHIFNASLMRASEHQRMCDCDAQTRSTRERAHHRTASMELMEVKATQCAYTPRLNICNVIHAAPAKLGEQAQSALPCPLNCVARGLLCHYIVSVVTIVWMGGRDKDWLCTHRTIIWARVRVFVFVFNR